MDLRAGGNPAYKDTVCQECQRFPWKTMALFLHYHLQWFRRTSNCLKPQSLDVLCAKTLENIRLSWMLFPDFYLLYVLLLWKVMLLKDDQNKSSNWFVVLGFASRHGRAVEGNWLLADNHVDVLKDEFRIIVRFCHQIWSLTVLVALKIIPSSGVFWGPPILRTSHVWSSFHTRLEPRGSVVLKLERRPWGQKRVEAAVERVYWRGDRRRSCQ